METVHLLILHGQSEELNALAADTKRLKHSEREMIEAVQQVAMRAASEIERLTVENSVLLAERDRERERFESSSKILSSIYSLLYPPRFSVSGKTFAFRPRSVDPHEVLQELSDRIKAIPDELAALAAKEA